ncbi:MAG: histidinol dehydrogenase, partial [Christensenellales bacterium]
MIKIFTENEVEEIFKRNENLSDKFDETVKQIIEDVKERKDKALLDYAVKFDKVRLDSLEVSEKEIEEAESQIDPLVKEAINEAASNIAEFHKRQLDDGFMMEKEDGIV